MIVPVLGWARIILGGAIVHPAHPCTYANVSDIFRISQGKGFWSCTKILHVAHQMTHYWKTSLLPIELSGQGHMSHDQTIFEYIPRTS